MKEETGYQADSKLFSNLLKTTRVYVLYLFLLFIHIFGWFRYRRDGGENIVVFILLVFMVWIIIGIPLFTIYYLIKSVLKEITYNKLVNKKKAERAMTVEQNAKRRENIAQEQKVYETQKRREVDILKQAQAEANIREEERRIAEIAKQKLETDYQKIYATEYQKIYATEYQKKLAEEQQKIEREYERKLLEERRKAEKEYQQKIDAEKQKRLDAEAAAREAREAASKTQPRSKNDSRSAFFQNPTRAAALQILGLTSGASIEDIKASYRKLSSLFHPDKYATLGTERQNEASEEMKSINLAYEILARQR